MSRLEEALARLERAVARLEAAFAKGGGEAGREERTAAAEAERLRLREIAGTISARVDGALGKIGRALGEEGG
jgi:hypothetical protein